MTGHEHGHGGFYGPKCWAASAVAGAVIGAAAGAFLPIPIGADGMLQVPLWLVVPFAGLLLSVATMPLVRPRFWHKHYPDVALFLGMLVCVFYLVACGAPGRAAVMHAGLEYYAFLALVGGLYVVSGNVLVRVRGKPSPLMNTAILATGAVLANLVGTTGASMLLIRPFMRLNRGRIQPLHVVFFIFVVSNCGGCLTPVGDPPLYLGYLKGVPFAWTAVHLWKDWLFVNGALLAIFFCVDARIPAASDPVPSLPGDGETGSGVSIGGTVGLVSLGLMLVGVFLDPMLSEVIDLHHIPVGATFQCAVAIGCFVLSGKTIRESNSFNFEPVKEVGLLFAGIFLTMMPALGYLGAHGASMGLGDADTGVATTKFFAATGGLSAILDNAPTYLNFLQVALSIEGHPEMSKEAVLAFSQGARGEHLLHAISAGAVFFGAMTYIGNGPNFMVKAIAEAESIKMPSFFGYVGYSLIFLLPILILNRILFV